MFSKGAVQCQVQCTVQCQVQCTVQCTEDLYLQGPKQVKDFLGD